MRLGCCVNMLASTATGIGDETIPLIAGLGYDYIELPMAQVMALDDDEFARLCGAVGQSGLPVEAFNNFFPAALRLTGKDADHGKALEYVRLAANRALRLGAKVIVLGSSGAKNIPEGFPRADARAQFVELLRGIDEIIGPTGITVALEPLNRTESNFINSVVEALDVMEEANRGSIRVLADYYHMRVEDEGLGGIARAGGDLRHVHIAAKESRRFPRQNDGEDYDGFFAALKGAGYVHRVSVEGYSGDIAGDAAAAARVLRPLMS